MKKSLASNEDFPKKVDECITVASAHFKREKPAEQKMAALKLA